MTPVPCISEPGEFGDCWRACIATILDLCANDVPHFFGIVIAENPDAKDHNAAAYAMAREWLREQGISIFRTYESGKRSLATVLADLKVYSPDVPIILHGEPTRSKDTDPAHAVVAMNGAIVNDPSGIGLDGPVRCDCGDQTCAGWWWIDVLCVGENWQCGALAG